MHQPSADQQRGDDLELSAQVHQEVHRELEPKDSLLSSNKRSMRPPSVWSRASSPLIASTTLTLSCRMIWTRAPVRRFIVPCMSGTKTSWGMKSASAVPAIQRS